MTASAFDYGPAIAAALRLWAIAWDAGDDGTALLALAWMAALHGGNVDG